ncbi:MAG: deazaflavin-dependent oxidoreductase (nitroreductase family) [Limisphaerales bacterium]|jgi:deazaflavin-dependent oxidoreductase (nitroreductase family)
MPLAIVPGPSGLFNLTSIEAVVIKYVPYPRRTIVGVKEYNKGIIEEFRANNGAVGGPFQGANLLLLLSKGAKSGEQRINPLAYFADGDDFLIIASYSGEPKNPPWFYNLVANPQAKIEVGSSELAVRSEVVAEPDRTELYNKIAAQASAFAEYQKKTTRAIPIVRLTVQ